MAINIADNFQYYGGKPLDSRCKFASVSEMKTMAEANLYNGCLAYVEANKKYYSWDSSNTVDETTGKWRIYNSGSSSNERELTQAEYNALSQAEKMNGTTYYITDASGGGGGGASSVSELTDVDLTGLANGDILKYNSTTEKWEAETESGGASSLSDLTDTTISSPTSGQVLKYNGSKWVNGSDADGAEIDDTTTSASKVWSSNKTNTEIGKAYKDSDSAFTALADGDYIPVYDTSATAKKKTLWSNVKSVLKTYFDTLYSTVKTSSSASSGGTDLSLVTTGEKYTWNSKQDASDKMTSTDMDDVVTPLPSVQSKYHRYSTDEHIVGVWVDGRYLYEKTIDLSSLTVPVGLTEISLVPYIGSNIGVIFILRDASYFLTVDSNYSGTYVYPLMSNNTVYSVDIMIGRKSTNEPFIKVQNTTAYDISKVMYITVRYTKSTDTPIE